MIYLVDGVVLLTWDNHRRLIEGLNHTWLHDVLYILNHDEVGSFG